MANKVMNATLEEGELEQSVCSFAEKSWFEECEEAEQKMTVSTANHNTQLFSMVFLPIFFLDHSL